jgi:hypothetical protein
MLNRFNPQAAGFAGASVIEGLCVATWRGRALRERPVLRGWL